MPENEGPLHIVASLHTGIDEYTVLKRNANGVYMITADDIPTRSIAQKIAEALNG